MGIIKRRILVDGNVKGKNITIETYHGDKIIKSRTDVLRSIEKRPTILTKQEATKSAQRVLKNVKNYYPEDYPDKRHIKVRNVEYISESKLWYAEFINIKTGKRLGMTYISDKTGITAVV